MDPLSAILFFIVGICLVALWNKSASNTTTLAALKTQMERFISDIESEKGTRRRNNHALTNRVRILEGQQPIPPHDSTET